MSGFKLHDNGLLEHYKQHAKNGFLDISSLDIKERQAVKCNRHCVSKILTPTGEYFIKSNEIFKELKGNSLNKIEMDKHIMAGQIYNQLGIKGAIYTPVTEIIDNEKIEGVISKSISDEENAIAIEKHPYYLPSLFIDKGYDRHNLTLSENYTKHGAQQILKMGIVDVATDCSDRRPANFTIRHKGEKIDDVGVFDYETLNYGREETYFFHNFNLCVAELPRKGMLYEFKHNEEIAKYIDRHELAQDIGDLNIEEIAEAITEATASENNDGYVVDEREIENLKRSCDEVAEALSQ